MNPNAATGSGDFNGNPVAERVKDLEWCADRSIRYHDRRRSFYETTDLLGNFVTFLSGSTAVISLLNAAAVPPFLALPAGAIVAIVSGLTIMIRPSTKASEHARLRQRFHDLRIRIAKFDGSDIRTLEAERVDIEREEPVIYRALDLLCHNELALAHGLTERWAVPWFMGLTANFWRWDTNHVKRET